MVLPQTVVIFVLMTQHNDLTLSRINCFLHLYSEARFRDPDQKHVWASVID